MSKFPLKMSIKEALSTTSRPLNDNEAFSFSCDGNFKETFCFLQFLAMKCKGKLDSMSNIKYKED
jgi:hypothetical protein